MSKHYTTLDEIITLHRSGQTDKAEQAYLQWLNDHPQDATAAAAYNNLGTIYFSQQKFDDAVMAYREAIRLQADYADAYYNLGLALIKLKKISEAEPVFQALIELAPQHAGAHFQLGCLLMQKQQYHPALNQFNIINQQYPFHFETLLNIASCCIRLGWLNEAKSYYLRALEIKQDDAEILFNLGVLATQQGYMDNAIEYYVQALSVNPDMFAAHNNLGTAFLAKRDYANALLHFRAALQLQPDNVAVRHTIHVLSQPNKIEMSPPEYIKTLFNSYADHYDAHLTESLHYQVPRALHELLSSAISLLEQQWDVLDLGCGTGLCGELFKHTAKHLIGVDLSPNMLAQAEAKHIYDELIEDNILNYLAANREQVDLIIAGDVLVYLGDLHDIIASISRVLRSGGYFVFNVEVGEEVDFEMTNSGRFRHKKEYIDKILSENNLMISQYQTTCMRYQEHQPVMGHVYLVHKS